MTHFLDAMLEPALWLTADWSLRWAVLIGVAALMLLFFRPRRAAMRQLICWVALLGGLLVPILPRWGGGWRLTKETAASPHADSSFPGGAWERPAREALPRIPPRKNARRSLADSTFPGGAWERERATVSSPREPLSNRRLVVLGLALCWALGVFVLLIRWLGGAWFLRRLRRGAVDVQGAAAETFAACRAELCIRGTVRLRTYPRVRSPVLLGLLRPAILVPSDWSRLPVDVQRAALLHELAHVRRRDHWLAPLLEMVRVAFFFHPLVRWLLGRLEYERELLCDEVVVGRGVDRRDYARMLLEFARQSGRFALPRLSGSSYLPIGRRRTVKARINHLLEENMERWMKPLSFRWAVVVGAGLLVLGIGLASYRIRAMEPEKARAEPGKPTALPNKAKNDPDSTRRKLRAAHLKREALRYGGKNFDQWRVELETELKPEVRADGLTALAAFGANGYGPEATQTVLELMKGYDLDTSDKKDFGVVQAAFAAIAKIHDPAVPVLWESLRDDNRRLRHFAIVCLERYGKDSQQHVSDLLKAVRDEDANVREVALKILLRIKEKPKSCVPVFLECLQDGKPAVRVRALENLASMQSEATKVMSALNKAIKDPAYNVQTAAIQIAGSYGAQAKPVVPALLERLNKPVSFDQFVNLMNALAAIGSEAKDALPKLRELREKDRDHFLIDPGNVNMSLGQLIDQTIKKIEGK